MSGREIYTAGAEKGKAKSISARVRNTFLVVAGEYLNGLMFNIPNAGSGGTFTTATLESGGFPTAMLGITARILGMASTVAGITLTGGAFAGMVAAFAAPVAVGAGEVIAYKVRDRDREREAQEEKAREDAFWRRRQTLRTGF
jgi:hypothetical protein